MLAIIFQETIMLAIIHLYIVTIVIILFNCVGLFGNSNVVIAVFRAPTLRTKAGYLMAVLCILQSICLLCELANLRLYWREDLFHIAMVVRARTVMLYSFCFCFLSVYMFVIIAQSLMYFVIVVDMLIAVALPLRHRLWSTSLYVIFMCMGPVLVAAVALIASYYYRTVEVEEAKPQTGC
ncbi:hypothetical protein Y032_0120g924 [Ancylostoma ceylanicum]|nr:hypothetical protein Y032_0120g924 [Ancylostoma ceylanicum]